MTGATITVTGTPARLSAAIASRRFRGVEARGSMVRARSRSRVVTERATTARRRRAMRERTSISRVTSADLVTIPTG